MKLDTPTPAIICALVMIACMSLITWTLTGSLGEAAFTWCAMSFVFCLVIASLINRNMK